MMNNYIRNKVIRFKDIDDFNCDHIFDCGQCFRWRRMDDGSWTGIAGARIANVKYIDETKTVQVTEYSEEEYSKSIDGKKSKDFWFDYLDLGRDYGSIKRKLSRGDNVMKLSVKSGQGIRILSQELWETIVSFIISQNNNIPRIKGCIERLSEIAGEKIKLGREDFDLGDLVPKRIPIPEVMASLTVNDLASVRLGYRAKYLIQAGREVIERGLPENYEEVLALTGVGPKVANCISLFGLRDMGSFPIDVWIKRVMHELYGFDEEDKRGMAEYANKHFGELSGIAQQYLFYYMRGFGKEQ